MEPLEYEDGFLCAGGRKLLFARSSSKKENGFVATADYYRCKDCSGCELQSKCFKSSGEVKNKEIRMCVESAEHRKKAFENLPSEDESFHSGRRSLWCAEKRPELPVLLDAGKNQHFNRTFSSALLLISRSSFPNCNAESENLIFFPSKKSSVFSELKM